MMGGDDGWLEETSARMFEEAPMNNIFPGHDVVVRRRRFVQPHALACMGLG